MNKKAQVWIETVIYTLIALAMIGMVMVFASPRIEEAQDKTILQQSINMLKEIDSTILGMSTAGNQRVIEIGIKKGALRIDGADDKIEFELETKTMYSEPGKEIADGNVIITTEEESGYYIVILTRDYSINYDIEFDGKDEVKEITKGSTAYKLLIVNEGGEQITSLNMSLI